MIRKILSTFGRISIVAAWVAIIPLRLPAQTPFDEGKFSQLNRAVVRIEAGEQVGSGIVIHQETDSVLVLTAYHVVQASRDHIQVYFYGDAMQRKWPAEVYKDSDNPDKKYDLAVLRVHVRRQGAAVKEETPVLNAGANPTEGTVVRAIGRDSDNVWIHSESSEVVRSTDADEIELFRFPKKNIAPGFSGGPVFNNSLELVGMTIETVEGDNLAKAMKIEIIVELLRGQFSLTDLNRLHIPERGSTALDELTQRYEQLFSTEKSLVEFFARRKKQVEKDGGHLRPQIEIAESETADHLKNAKKYLDAKQTPTAEKALEAAAQSIKLLESMK